MSAATEYFDLGGDPSDALREQWKREAIYDICDAIGELTARECEDRIDILCIASHAIAGHDRAREEARERLLNRWVQKRESEEAK